MPQSRADFLNPWAMPGFATTRIGAIAQSMPVLSVEQAATDSISPLSGDASAANSNQIDGSDILGADFLTVLLTNQDDATENGVWLVCPTTTSPDWIRVPAPTGSLITVRNGSDNSGTCWCNLTEPDLVPDYDDTTMGQVGNGGLTSDTISLTLDGGGAVIASGSLQGANVVVTQDCTITGWTITADTSGTIQLDVTADSGTIPTTSITGGAYPSLSGTSYNTGGTTYWTTDLSAGDVVGFAIIGTPTSCTRITLALEVQF